MNDKTCEGGVSKKHLYIEDTCMYMYKARMEDGDTCTCTLSTVHVCIIDSQ